MDGRLMIRRFGGVLSTEGPGEEDRGRLDPDALRGGGVGVMCNVGES